jgi:hypothetical protein
MKAAEFISEVTNPNNPPPSLNDPEFQKSKESFVKIINQFTAQYNKSLNDMKSMAPTEYKQLIQNRQEMISDFQKKLSDTLIAKGNNFITARDFNDIGLNKIKFSSGAKQSKQTTTAVPQQTTTPQTSETPPVLGGLKPGDPNYAALAAALEKQSKKNAPNESIEEAVLNLSKNAVILTPKEIDSLATRSTQVWYKNRQLNTQNPQLYAKLIGKNNLQSTGSSGIGLTAQNRALASIAGGVNPELGNKDFTQAFVNTLNSLYNRSDIDNILLKIKKAVGIFPTQPQK